MKSIEELYKEVMENEALKAEFATAYREGNVSEFLKKHDCDATAEEVSEYVNGVKDEALSLDDLDNVAGGGDAIPDPAMEAAPASSPVIRVLRA